MAPIIKQQTLALTGAKMKVLMTHEQEICLSFTEDGTNPKPWLFWSTSAWCGRAARMEGSDSIAHGIKPTRDDHYMRIGTDAQMNVAGATLHYLTLKDNRSGKIVNTNYMGSSVAGVVTGWSPKMGATAPDFVMIKRDSSYAPCAWFRGMPAGESVIFDGTGVITNGILGTNSDGTINVGTAPNVNNLPAPPNGSIGEGHDCMALWQQNGLIEIVTWVGDNGTNKKVVDHTVSNPVGLIVVAHAPTIKGGFKTASMGTKMTHAGTSALIDNAIVSLSGGGINVGSDNRYNQQGIRYFAVVIGESNVEEIRDRIQFASDPGEVFFRGSATSNVNCGTSNTLSLSGPHSVGWRGKIKWAPSNGAVGPCMLVARSMGDIGRADSDGLANGAGTRLDGLWSHGIGVVRYSDIADWVAQFTVVVGNYFNPLDFAGGENDIRTKPWRTGITVPFNVPVDVRTTTDGAGLWYFYKNMRLLKQRKLDLSQVTIADDAGTRVNGGAGSGHTTMFGAYMGSAGVVSGIGEIVMYGADFHASMLSQAEIDRLYNRLQLGDTTFADVIPVERWAAKDVSGTSWPAIMNAANNGTLTMAAKMKYGSN